MLSLLLFKNESYFFIDLLVMEGYAPFLPKRTFTKGTKKT